MTTEKPIDLGKLQDTHKKAQLNLVIADRDLGAAKRAVLKAQEQQSRAVKKHDDAKNIVDRAAAAMLDGARTIASN